MLQKYKTNKNPQKTVKLSKSSTVDTGCLGNITHNKHNLEMLVKIGLN
jgi:hypothetical protein